MLVYESMEACISILLHLHSGVDGDVVTVHSYWNVIMCKITAQPRGPMQRWHEERRPW
jgi:hypothetical protein